MLGLALTLGCASVKPKAPRHDESPAASIDQINLLAVPVALNFDQAPGLDGFVVKIYAGNRGRAKPVPILSGSVEVLMYDGVVREYPKTVQPRRTWKYSAEELKSRLTKTSIGTGYQVAPQWGDAKPAGDKISVVARYTPPQGAAIYSAPSVIAVPGN